MKTLVIGILLITASVAHPGDDRLNQLKRANRNAARQVYNIAKRRLDGGLMKSSFAIVLLRKRLRADLVLASDDGERKQAWRSALGEAQRFEELSVARHEAGLGEPHDPLLWKRERLKAQLGLLECDSTKERSDKTIGLKKEIVNVCEQITKNHEERHRRGVEKVDTSRNAHVELMVARLAASNSDKEKLSAINSAIKSLRLFEKVAEARSKTGLGEPAELYLARHVRLIAALSRCQMTMDQDKANELVVELRANGKALLDIRQLVHSVTVRITAQRVLLEAELAGAKTKADQRTALEMILKNAKDLERRCVDRNEARPEIVPAEVVLEARAHRLTVEVQLAELLQSK